MENSLQTKKLVLSKIVINCRIDGRISRQLAAASWANHTLSSDARREVVSARGIHRMKQKERPTRTGPIGRLLITIVHHFFTLFICFVNILPPSLKFSRQAPFTVVRNSKVFERNKMCFKSSVLCDF